jgi:hypothetical protein
MVSIIYFSLNFIKFFFKFLENFLSNVLLKSPKNLNFNPEANVNNINKINLNLSSNKNLIKSPKNIKIQDSSILSERLKENQDYIQEKNIEFFEKLNKNNDYKKENDVLIKMNKFREYKKKQKEYLENTKKNIEIINDIQTDQAIESNLKQNLADNLNKAERKKTVKGSGININIKL